MRKIKISDYKLGDIGALTKKVLIRKICAYCGKEFKTLAHGQKNCSESCRHSWSKMRGREKSIARKCKLCGKEFTRLASVQKFCTESCRLLWLKIRTKEREKEEKEKQGITRKCKFCARQFNRLTHTQKFCSKLCRILWLKAENIKQEIITKKCRICGKKFKTNISFKIYCSLACQIKSLKFHSSYSSYSLLVWKILSRDNFQCQYCGKNPTQDKVKLEVDHIKPKADGGTNEFNNLITACSQCNSSKRSRPLRHEAEFRKRLHRNIPSKVQFHFDFYSGKRE